MPNAKPQCPLQLSKAQRKAIAHPSKDSAIALPPSTNEDLPMISQSYPTVAKYAALATPSTQNGTVVPLNINLDNGHVARVAHNTETNAVSRWNAKTKSFQFFRSLEEATRELNLEAMGLTKVSTILHYRGTTIVLYGSVFSQAPQQVKDQYLDEDCFLKTDNSFIWHFAYADEYGTQWYSHELRDNCKYIFKGLVDRDCDQMDGYEF
jgi:hypothetical protein